MNKLSPYEPGPGETTAQRSYVPPFTSGPAPDPSAGRENDLGNLKRIIRRWPIPIILAAVFAGIGLGVSHFIPREYESDSEVLLQAPGQQNMPSAASQVAALAGFGGGGTTGPDIPTQIEVMTSDQALKEVAARSGIQSPPGALRGKITISPHKTSTSIVLVAVRDSSPTRAQIATTALIDVYNEHMEERNSTSNGRTILSTKTQLAQVAAKLSESETAFANYSRKVGSLDPTADGTQQVTELYKIRENLLSARQDLLVSNGAARVYQEEINSLSPTVVPTLTLVPSPLIAADENKLSDLLEERNKLSALYTPRDSEMVENQEQIDAIKADIKAETDRQSKAVSANLQAMDASQKSGTNITPGYTVSSVTHVTNPDIDTLFVKLQTAKAQARGDEQAIASLTEALASANADIANSPAKMRILGDLQNDCIIYQKMYDTLEAQLVSLDAQLPANQAYAQILELPTAPTKPVEPKPGLYAAAAGGFGLLVGIILLLLMDFFDPTIRDEADIAEISNVPVLQSLPFSHLGDTSARSVKLSQQRYQRLAAALIYRGLGTSVRTLALTSTSSGEGSGTVALKLANALAQGGTKILLIDATGATPRIVNVGTPELSAPHSASSNADASVEIAASSANGTAPNVNSLLQSSDTSYLVDKLKEDYDVVIFDAPAVFDGVRTAALTKQVDAVLYVSKLEGVTREEVRQALGLVLNGSTPVLGVVLNDSRL